MTSREKSLSIIIVLLAVASIAVSRYGYHVGYFAAKEIWHDARCETISL